MSVRALCARLHDDPPLEDAARVIVKRTLINLTAAAFLCGMGDIGCVVDMLAATSEISAIENEEPPSSAITARSSLRTRAPPSDSNRCS